MAATAGDSLFLGLDCSTQGLKATLIDGKAAVVSDAAVNYDADLPEFRTQGGAHKHPDGLTVTAPAIMWVAAFDLLLQKLRSEKWPLSRVAAVSGSGQQHGSVWLAAGARTALQSLRPERSLREQLSSVFSVADSPIWMDASTRRQCKALEKALGGAQAVADLTGSRAYERFTGNQIAKIHQTQKKAYEATERIALVSSFFACLLTGDYASIDTSDGSGMNLMDIRTKRWSPAALRATAPDLAGKLGPILPGHAVAGKLHGYYVRRYGFASDCVVIAFSGDNPCSLAGLRLQRPGEVAVSLGTSDTMFGSARQPHPSGVEGHVFANPIDPDAYMIMLVHQNGSLTRQRIRDACAKGSWDTFNRMLESVPPGNNGRIGFYFDEPEITPPVQKAGIRRFDPAGRPVAAFDPEAEVRAVVESQFLSLRLHGERIGLRPASVLATGGASANPAILRVLSDVYGCPVFVSDQTASASLGAAYRALHGWRCARARRFVPFAKALADAPPFRKALEPRRNVTKIYTDGMVQYAKMEDKVVRGEI